MRAPHLLANWTAGLLLLQSAAPVAGVLIRSPKVDTADPKAIDTTGHASEVSNTHQAVDSLAPPSQPIQKRAIGDGLPPPPLTADEAPPSPPQNRPPPPPPPNRPPPPPPQNNPPPLPPPNRPPPPLEEQFMPRPPYRAVPNDDSGLPTRQNQNRPSVNRPSSGDSHFYEPVGPGRNGHFYEPVGPGRDSHIYESIDQPGRSSPGQANGGQQMSNRNPVYGEGGGAQTSRTNPVNGEGGGPQTSKGNPIYGEGGGAQTSRTNPVNGEGGPQMSKGNPIYGESGPKMSKGNPIYGESSSGSRNPIYSEPFDSGRASPEHIYSEPVDSQAKVNKNPIYGESPDSSIQRRPDPSRHKSNTARRRGFIQHCG